MEEADASASRGTVCLQIVSLPFFCFVLRSAGVWGSFGNRLVGWFGLRELPGRFIRPGCLLGGPWLGFVGSFGARFGIGRNCCEWRLGMVFWGCVLEEDA